MNTNRNNVTEVARLRGDDEAYKNNFDEIDWTKTKDSFLEKEEKVFMILTPNQYNKIYSESTGIIISEKAK